MIKLRKAEDRGRFDHGWLHTSHTFSFGQYYDPNYMGFRTLRVINEDHVIPGAGFGTHSHRDMEIITYVLEGGLEHKDSLGTGAVIYPGEVQRMSAGTGISHSEFNHSKTEPVHLLQIWILPQKQGLPPSYEQRHFPLEEKQGKLRLVADEDGRDQAVTVHQDVELYACVLEPSDRVSHQLQRDRHAWVQVIRGGITLNGHSLAAGDGAAISDEDKVDLKATTAAEFLLFDLA